MTNTRSLDEQREEYAKRRFMAMPLAGTLAWLVTGIASVFLDEKIAAFVLFGATGSIVYLGMFLSKFTGENFMDKSRPKNTFDSMFMHTVSMSLLVYAIAIPFFLVEPTSLPLTVGILTGLMWLPLSWAIQHWIGVFHAVSRTGLILVLWYAFPQERFVSISFAIVAIYLITLVVLQTRWKAVNGAHNVS